MTMLTLELTDPLVSAHKASSYLWTRPFLDMSRSPKNHQTFEGSIKMKAGISISNQEKKTTVSTQRLHREEEMSQGARKDIGQRKKCWYLGGSVG